MTRLGPSVEVLKPYADWQIYQRSREMYGAIYDWHTLEGLLSCDATDDTG
jgi:hypothetical protein